MRSGLRRLFTEWGPVAAATLAAIGSIATSASFAGCHAEQVVAVPGCSEPCCGGNAGAIDCGKTPTIACSEMGDPCTARDYGCSNGAYYLRARAPLPTTCAAVEAGLVGDDGGGAFGDLDADDGEPDDSATAPDVGADGSQAAPTDASADGAADGAVDARVDAVADGPPDAP